MQEREVEHGHVNRRITDEVLQPIEVCESEKVIVAVRIRCHRLPDQLGGAIDSSARRAVTLQHATQPTLAATDVEDPLGPMIEDRIDNRLVCRDTTAFNFAATDRSDPRLGVVAPATVEKVRSTSTVEGGQVLAAEIMSHFRRR